MKTTAIIIGVIAFLAVCVSMAWTKREAERMPTLEPGTTWKYTQEHQDRGLDKYLIRILTNKKVTDQEAKELAEYARRTHAKAGNHVIFFDEPTRIGAYLKVTYPAATFEQMENYAR